MTDPEKRKGFLDRLMSEADETAHPILRTIQEYQNIIISVVAVVLIVSIGYSGYTFYQERQQEQASERLNEILAIQDQEDRIQALEDFLETAPSAIHDGILLELAHLYMQTERYQEAAQSFQRLEKEQENIQPIAVLGRAKALELQGEYQHSLQILEDAREDIPEEFRNQHRVQVAFVAEQTGNYRQALEAYKELRDHAQGMDVGFFDYKIQTLQNKLEQ